MLLSTHKQEIFIFMINQITLRFTFKGSPTLLLPLPKLVDKGISDLFCDENAFNNVKIIHELVLILSAPTPQNGQKHLTNSSVNCRRIAWVCLTILWDWRLKG